MNCLVVIAHPVPGSLCHQFSRTATETLVVAGHEVQIEDLYHSGFAAALTVEERLSYYAAAFNPLSTQPQIDRLLLAEGLVLVFPTWWFGFPAILKGWFDRVWAPGIAYHHATDRGPIIPLLHHIRHALAITSLGSTWRIDRLVMRRTVRRIMKTAILRPCAPRCRFEMLSLCKAENVSSKQIDRVSSSIRAALDNWS